MNSSKPSYRSGEQQTSREVQRASTFPSPRPSPSGRGRMLRWLSAQPSAVSVRRSSRRTELAAVCSLSPWERVRVRGFGLPFDTASPTIPEIVELRESSGGVGGFPRQ